MALAVQQQFGVGGIFGALRSLLLSDTRIQAAFGTRIAPGRLATGWSSQNASATTPMSVPYIQLSDVGSTYHSNVQLENGQTIDIYDSQLQLTVFAGSYEQGRELSQYVHSLIRNAGYVNCDNIAVWIQPSSYHELLSPVRSETGSDIWQMIRRYRYWLPNGVMALNTFSTVNGNGTLTLPAMGASGSQ